MATCTASVTSPVVIASASASASASSSRFVTRNGSNLQLDGAPFRASGANIYWLGLDENEPIDSPTISWPSHERILEALATVVAMGGNSARVHTAGISVGCAKCMGNALGEFNEDAMRVVDFVLAAARSYGLRLIIPLADQYDYYHGGIPTFLRWRNLSSTDYSPFYDTSSQVYNDFTTYVRTLLSRNNTITGIRWGDDATILALETGNEINPPVAWTSAISAFIKGLAPNTLVMDGTHGVNSDALDLETVDLYSNHAYPRLESRLRSDTKLVASHGKAFIEGEIPSTDKLSHLNLLGALIPCVFAVAVWCLPGRWFPIRVRRPRRKRSRAAVDYVPVDLTPASPSPALDKLYDPPVALPVLPAQLAKDPGGFLLRKWHLSLFCVVWVPIAIGIAWATGPSYLNTAAESSAAGTYFWSLLGRTDDCCAYVPHNDGFTLWWNPSDSSDMQSRDLVLAQHIRRMTGQVLPAAAQMATNVQVACPQGNSTTLSRWKRRREL